MLLCPTLPPFQLWLLVSLPMCEFVPLHEFDLVYTFVCVLAWKFVPIFEIPPCEFAITCIFPCVAIWWFPPLNVLACTFVPICACAFVFSCGDGELHASSCEMLMPRLQKHFIVQQAHGALLQGNDGALP